MKKSVPFSCNPSLLINFIFICFTSLYIFSDFRGYDPDLWGHLAFGRYVLTTMTIPHQDVMAYLPVKDLWINHEWLTGITFFLILKYFTSVGLLVFKVLMSTIVILLCFQQNLQRTTLHTFLTLFYFVGILAYSYGTAVRAQLFTYLIFALVLILLETRFNKPKELLIFLPFLTLLSANFHGGVAAVLLLITFYTLAKVLCQKERLIYLTLPIVSFLSTFINPYGLNYWTYLIKALLMHRKYIGEWESVPLDFISFLPFKILLFMTVIIMIRACFKKVNILHTSSVSSQDKIVDILLLILFTYFALKHSRHIPFFVITTLLLTPKYFWVIPIPELSSLFNKGKKIITLFMTISIPFLVINTFSGRPYNLVITEKITNKYVGYPVSAVHYIQSHHLQGNILCFFDWGEFLIWNLYPHCKVSFDGRFETVYTDQTIEDNWNLLKMGPKWEYFLNKYPHDMILLPKNFKIIQMLTNMPQWQLIHLGEESALFLKQKD